MARRGATPLGEFDLIDRYFRPLATDPGALGLADDVAIVAQTAGTDLVVSADMVIEGVHFFTDDAPSSIARKALRVNLSDLAAKGAEPFAYFMSLALPSGRSGSWIAAFARALKADQKTYGMSLLGGDTSRSPEGVTVAITVLGRVPKAGIVARRGARPGDSIYVSGTIGDAALGLLIRRGEIAAGEAGRGAGRLLDRYLHPRPRVEMAPVLRRHARAAVDISDGLWADLGHICSASGVSATVEAGLVPLSAPARRLVESAPARLRVAVTGGDDYEILAAVDSARSSRFEKDAAAVGVTVSRIGAFAFGNKPPRFVTETGVMSTEVPLGHNHMFGSAD